MRTAALPVMAMTAALLAGCGATAGSVPAVNVPTAAAVAPSSPEPVGPEPGAARSDRGNVVKKIGEPAAFGPTQDNLVVKFVIDKITVGAKCTNQFSQPAEHGTFLKLDIRVETMPTLPNNSFYSISPFDFSTVGPDGVTDSSLYNGSAAMCDDATEQLPPTLAPASKYRGSIVLDTRNTSGTLILRPAFLAAGGWEWQYAK